MRPEAPILGIVLVVYKSAADTEAFVRHQLPKVHCPYRAVVVDLGSDIEHTRGLAARCGTTVCEGDLDPGQTVYFLHCQENLGYARGNNLGARVLLKHFGGITALLFSNTDIEMLTPDTVSLLLARLESLPEVACIGPRVVGLDGGDQSPLYEPISLGEIICSELLSAAVCRRYLSRRAQRQPNLPPEEGYCYTVMGCFLMVRASDFTAAGMFDPHTFLYREEEIISERLLRLHKRAYYLATAVVRHYGGKTIGKYIPDHRVNRLHFESSCYYYRAYRGATATQLGLFRLAKAISLTRAALLRLLRNACGRAAPPGAAGSDRGEPPATGGGECPAPLEKG